MKYASFDFHLHTLWSYDATAPVEEYFRLAQKRGVKYLAITEHHTMDSFPEIQKIAPSFPDVSYIAGAELTVWSELGTFDMVCLGLPPEPTGELAQVLDSYHQWQRDYGDAVSAVLTAAGHPYSREDRLSLLQRYRPARTIEIQGITHVQNAVQDAYLVEEKKYFSDAKEMHSMLWKSNLPNYPAADIVIPAVKKAGGIVFIAHPTHYFQIRDLKRMDALRELLNFDGIECAHESVPTELTPFYREYCLKYNLLSTAGTDCHSIEGDFYRFCGESELGRHIGEDVWRDAILERVKIY